MKSEEQPQKTRMVHHRFEPDRLSAARLADAYEKIVPRSIRFLEVGREANKPEWVQLRPVIGDRHGARSHCDLCPGIE
jgi:hypothetical protein